MSQAAAAAKRAKLEAGQDPPPLLSPAKAATAISVQELLASLGSAPAAAAQLGAAAPTPAGPAPPKPPASQPAPAPPPQQQPAPSSLLTSPLLPLLCLLLDQFAPMANRLGLPPELRFDDRTLCMACYWLLQLAPEEQLLLSGDTLDTFLLLTAVACEMQLQAQFQQLQTQQLAAIYAVAQQLARHACSATPLDPQALAEMRRSLVARCMAAKSLQALHPPAGGAPPPGSAQPQPSTPHPQAAGGAAQPSLGAAQPSLDWLGSAGSREWPPPAPPSAEQHLEPDGRQEGAQQEQSHVAELQAGEQAGEDPEQQQQDPAGERESKEYWAGVLRKLVPRLRRNPAAAAKFKQLI